jgi:hypothetical protein
MIDLRIPDNTPKHCKHRNWMGIEAYCLHTVKAFVTISGPSTVSSDAPIAERLEGELKRRQYAPECEAVECPAGIINGP